MKIINAELLTEIKQIKNDNGNFQTIKKKIGEERLKEFILSIYPKFSITEIETITGIPDSTLMHWFKRLNIPSIRNHIKNIAIPGEIDSNLVISKGAICYKVSTIKITPELAYVIGFVLGDGSVQNWMVEVFNKEQNLRKILFEYLSPYGSITEDRRDNGLWRLRLSNGKIASLIKFKKRVRKDTIEYIFSNDELTRKFLAAFWDAEGTVRRQGNYFHIYLYNTDKYLMDTIGGFLTRKDIKFSVHSRKTRDKETILDGHIIKSKKILFRISIPKSSVGKWINEIGIYLNHSKKREIVNEMLNVYGGKEK